MAHGELHAADGDTPRNPIRTIVPREGCVRATEAPWYLSLPGHVGPDPAGAGFSVPAGASSANGAVPGGHLHSRLTLSYGRVRGGRPQGGWQLAAGTY